MTTPTPQDIERAREIAQTTQTTDDLLARMIATALASERERWQAELRERNSDLSYMAGERDILLKAIEQITGYDDGTKMIINGECSSIAGHALDALKSLRDRKAALAHPAPERK